MNDPFTFYVYMCFHTDFVDSGCVCSLVQAESQISSPILGYVCSRCFSVEIGAIVLPMILCAMGLFTFLGCCGFLLGHFGHDRAKNNSRIGFPNQSFELLILLHVCSGWSLEFVGVGMKDWYA